MTAGAWTFTSGMEVLRRVAAGESPWSGWDSGVAARTGEASDAYAERWDVIDALRRDGFLTEHNHLTDQGQSLVAMERAHG